MGIKAGVVGVGPVGQNIYRCIRELGLECEEVRMLATSARVEVIDGEEVPVHSLGTEFSEEGLKLFEGLDVAFFAGREGDKGAAKTWAMAAIDRFGVYCIDNGADFRMDPEIPLVVPEVNMDTVTSDTRLIASPNCSTIQMCVALAPLHSISPLKRVVVSTFQSVSGYGREAQAELVAQLKQMDPDNIGGLLKFDPKVFRRQIALDCLPHIDAFMDNGYTKEELKMRYETRKIFGDDSLDVVATAVRVPVEIGHAESINAEFKGPMSAAVALDTWRAKAEEYGIVVIDQPAKDTLGWPTPSAPKDDTYMGHRYAEERAYPTQADVLKEGWKNLVLVGRTRDDYSQPNTINFWCVSDNLRKGAATNVVQIGKKLAERGLIG
ncbi:MAG: aspartate-semialdehyde dehydrogenase [Armatimonadetes bacterium]|nr:aspartate-semialdehyde dehydrogenase [Armatimonadota bacterium]